MVKWLERVNLNDFKDIFRIKNIDGSKLAKLRDSEVDGFSGVSRRKREELKQYINNIEHSKSNSTTPVNMMNHWKKSQPPAPAANPPALPGRRPPAPLPPQPPAEVIDPYMDDEDPYDPDGDWDQGDFSDDDDYTNDGDDDTYTDMNDGANGHFSSENEDAQSIGRKVSDGSLVDKLQAALTQRRAGSFKNQQWNPQEDADDQENYENFVDEPPPPPLPSQRPPPLSSRPPALPPGRQHPPQPPLPPQPSPSQPAPPPPRKVSKPQIPPIPPPAEPTSEPDDDYEVPETATSPPQLPPSRNNRPPPPKPPDFDEYVIPDPEICVDTKSPSEESRPPLPPIPGSERKQSRGGSIRNVRDPLPKVPVSQEADALLHFDWYQSSIQRPQAENRLKAENQDGMFLVRKSVKVPNQPYTLMIHKMGKVFNLPIRRRTDNKYALGKEKAGEPTFNSVPDMVEYFQKRALVLNPQLGRDGQTVLTQALPKT